jgi:hypothetical protein
MIVVGVGGGSEGLATRAICSGGGGRGRGGGKGGGARSLGQLEFCLNTKTPLIAVGVGRGADMSLARFLRLWDKILSQNLQAVADQGCHLEGSSSHKGTAYRGVYCTWQLRMKRHGQHATHLPFH